MAFIFAVAGKGGTGKTSLCALLVRALMTKKGSILAIDADPNTNLNEALGVELSDTIGNIRQDTLSKQGVGIPGGMTKQQYFNYKISQAVVETKHFDLIAMGRPEGAGCYCYANNVIQDYLDKIAADYDFIVMDNEAGLEHLARRTTHMADALLAVSDPSVRSVRSAVRVKQLVEEIDLEIKKLYMVISRSYAPLSEKAQSVIKAGQMDLLATIPRDDNLADLDTEGISLLELPDDSPAVQAAIKMVDKILAAAKAS